MARTRRRAVAGVDFMYFLEVMDCADGDSPELEHAQRYVLVR